MTMISLHGKRLAKKKRRSVIDHLAGLGFTNRLALYIIAFLAAGLIGGFYLARESIQTGYTGALMCWTVVFTPIGTAASLVLGKIVTKSTIENCGADGEGSKYAAAKAAGFTTTNQEGSEESPAI